MWTYDGSQCVSGCDVAGSGEYDSESKCCDEKFPSMKCKSYDMCFTSITTFEPTPAPTECVCEDQMWTYDGSQCDRGCDVEGSDDYTSSTDCCDTVFGEGFD